MTINPKKAKTAAVLAGLALWSFALTGSAIEIIGLHGNTFHLTAKSGYITTPIGESILTWGYADGNSVMQYPGPTLIVNQGDPVTVYLKNELGVPVSIIFPGQEGVTASGGVPGVMTNEVPGADLVTEVTYTFTASHAGTYIYQSGTDMQLQAEMGLVGALIVRPMMAMTAYDSMDTMYMHEYLFFETEMDPIVHELVEMGRTAEVDFSTYFPVYWFFNGRNAPDTMAGNSLPWLPHQPYNCMPMAAPGETVLMRVINASGNPHPLHTHGNFFKVIANDGRLLESAPGMGPDLAYKDFTITVPSGGSADALYVWTGEKLGWDVYGHAPGDPMEPGEYAPDHGKPFPVMLPNPLKTVPGAFYTGSPFLGASGLQPPGSCNVNPMNAYGFMWHSHKEKELTNNDVFPGGMMTMLMVVHPMTPMMGPVINQCVQP